jgi:erythromycin esterase
MKLCRLAFAACFVSLGFACSAPQPKGAVAAWIADSAAPADPKSAAFAPFSARLRDVRVVGLGEATHGQHESFEKKRELTMHLVRELGFRWVAYEASATRARATEAYVQGEHDDLDAAMKGLGMLIWNVEENATFLRELREFNAQRPEGDRVHFVGIDVQDAAATSARLAELLASQPELAARATEVAAQLEPAAAKLWSGDLEDYERVVAAATTLRDDVERACAARPDLGAECRVRAGELRLGVELFRTPGGRDAALAKTLLAELDRVGPAARAVVWAHDGHVMRSPLRYLESDELAMGGHLAAALGDGYYALGFLFGEGEFQANDRDANGAWGFRRYVLGPPPPGSLEAPFVEAGARDVVIDLRTAPRDGAIGAWLEAGHGQRWYGGYGIAADWAEVARDATRLLPTFPRADYDGLLFLGRTRAASPRDPARILSEGR